MLARTVRSDPLRDPPSRARGTWYVCRRGLTTSTEASTDTVHASVRVDLINDDLSALGDEFFDGWGVVQRDWGIEAGGRSDSRDGQGLAVNDYGFP